jgi:hypothetical protein
MKRSNKITVTLPSTAKNFYHQEKKNHLILLPQSQDNSMKTNAYRETCLLHEGLTGRCETQLGPLIV